MNEYQKQVEETCNAKTSEILEQLPDFIKKYFYYLKITKQPRTQLQYARDLKRFFDWIASSDAFKNENIYSMTAHDILDKLTIDDMQEYLLMISNSSAKSNSFLARNIAALKSFFKYYYRLQEIEKNLGDFLDMPKINDKEIKVLNNDQVKRILNAVFDETNMTQKQKDARHHSLYRDYAILMLFFSSGLRVSELVGLNETDIDYQNQSMIVTRKGGDQDEVFLSNDVIQAINNYKQYERAYLKANTDESALFISQKHSRMSVQTVEVMIKKYTKLAGVNVNVTPHTLRRTFGTNLYNQTGDIELVADALHHRNIQTTRKHYAKISNEHKKIVAKLADDLYKD